MRSATAVVLSALGLLLASVGEAAAAKVMVTPPSGEADEAAKVSSALREGLRKAGYTVVKTDTKIEDAAVLLGCSPAADACLARVAATAGAEFIVSADVAPASPGAERVVRVTVYRGTDGGRTGDVEVKYAGAATNGTWATSVAPLLVAGGTASGSADVLGDLSAGSSPDASTSDATSVPPDEGRRGDVPGKILPLTWGVAGGAVVLLAVGSYFAVHTGAVQHDFDAAPLATASDLRAAFDLARKGKVSAALGKAFLVTGAVAALAAVYLVLDNLYLGVVIRVEPDYSGASASVRF